MPYIMLEDFAMGLDRRKSAITSRPGALRALTNAFINAGGEIEKRKAFLDTGADLTGTVGFGSANDKPHVLKHTGTPVAPLPLETFFTPNPPAQLLNMTQFGSDLFAVYRRLDNAQIDYAHTTQPVLGTPLGIWARTFREKMYLGGSGSILRFSGIGRPFDYRIGEAANTGAGLIDVTSQDSGSIEIVTGEPYYEQFALLGRRAIQIWALDPDPARNQHIQTISNIGAIAHRGVCRYGTGDVLFLSETGIRSLRARDSSNSAVLNDIGSPIDNIITARIATATAPELERVHALVDPLTGHFWLIWGSTIYVLALYPATKVTAWSTFQLPAEVSSAAVVDKKILVRAGDVLYSYGARPSMFGSPPASEYDSSAVVIETPMIDAQQPATFKSFEGLDVACEGTWTVEVAPDPLAPDVWTHVATVNSPTYSLQRVPFQAYTTHVALRLTSTNDGFARLGSVAVHFSGGDVG